MDANMSIGRELRALNNMIKREVQRRCGDPEHDITIMHGWAIIYLYENSGRDIFQKDLERTFQIRGPTVTRILQLMEKNGLIERLAVSHDARLKKITLTEKAIRIHKKMESNFLLVENKLIENLSEEEINMFFSIVEKIKKGFE